MWKGLKEGISNRLTSGYRMGRQKGHQNRSFSKVRVLFLRYKLTYIYIEKCPSEECKNLLFFRVSSCEEESYLGVWCVQGW